MLWVVWCIVGVCITTVVTHSWPRKASSRRIQDHTVLSDEQFDVFFGELKLFSPNYKKYYRALFEGLFERGYRLSVSQFQVLFDFIPGRTQNFTWDDLIEYGHYDQIAAYEGRMIAEAIILETYKVLSEDRRLCEQKIQIGTGNASKESQTSEEGSEQSPIRSDEGCGTEYQIQTISTEHPESKEFQWYLTSTWPLR